jgi:hypothetical protein
VNTLSRVLYTRSSGFKVDALDDLLSNLSGPSRAIIIAKKDVDLRPEAGDNVLFLLKIGEGSLAAGGRGGGFGERKVIAVMCFELKGGAWKKLFQASEDQVSSFEVPYHVSRIPMTMADGTETMGYGVVEEGLVNEMSNKSGIPSSA